MQPRAFIFDLDGVLIDSENWWDKLYFKKAGHSLGQTIGSAFNQAKKTDPGLSWDEYFTELNRLAKTIYGRAPLAPGINRLINYLLSHRYRLALVSGSTQKWINEVISRLRQPINLTLSLQDRPELKPKPDPDGYLEAMHRLRVSPKNTTILEDTDMGIKSGKAAGAKVVCLTLFHPQNYRPAGADLYVKNIAELLVYLDSVKI